MSERDAQIAIIGVGNRAAGDDAIGMLVLDALRGEQLPPDVVLIEAGLAGPGLVSQMDGYAKVILIDAVDMGLPAGAVRAFNPSAVKSVKPEERLSLHGCDLLQVIDLATRLGLCPEDVLIVGVQPKHAMPGVKVDEAVAGAVPTAVEQVMREAYL